MKSLRFLALLRLLLAQFFIFAQSNLPIIEANSEVIDIREGEYFGEGQWRIMPEYKPDIYTSNQIGKTVTFYTGVDSISYTIHPDSIYNFIVLLNGKDSAYTQIKYEPSYLDVLKGAVAYDEKEAKNFPEFTYQDASDPNLQTLRKKLKLDSIAGEGNEVSKILNLLHWMHELVPHDGNHENPVVKNAISMINQCQQEDRGLNCRGLSIALNECYLAMGFKARHVTCMPKDSVFNDCHVINMVYSNDLDKWIWVDPTHDAYIMDETGTLLGFKEVRTRLINGQTLILNPTANWNKRSSTIKEYYLLEYMAKNLYRFSTPLHSGYDYETWNKGKRVAYVELLPLDAHQQSPKFEERKSENTGVHFTTYKTNNPEWFWAKPKN